MKLSFVQKAQIALSKKKRLLVLGDSHASIFSEKGFQRLCDSQYRCYVESVGGATISGLTNPNSKTNALASFKQSYEQIKPDVVITQIGEVDTGFVIWYRAQKYNAPVTEMLNKALNNYRELLSTFRGKDKTIAISAPLPTIRDKQDWGEIANARKEVSATQAQRTELTLQFNQAVNKICGDVGVEFINLDDDSLGPNGVVADYLINSDKNDHHYDKASYLPLLIKHLNGVL
ncbi:SGNH/GDSL hydrolase family protein [Glaciecola siphonariae]|uniref:SGNH/GDSL hydrolase family protein n=1 Tax=Glaciecola siphonariae TaxID=521012 RepID=A0ABV9LWC5_9ALTE